MKKGESKKIQCQCEEDCWTVHLLGGDRYSLQLKCVHCKTIIKFRLPKRGE